MYQDYRIWDKYLVTDNDISASTFIHVNNDVVDSLQVSQIVFQPLSPGSIDLGIVEPLSVGFFT